MTTATAPAETRIEDLDIDDIGPSPGQPREDFDQAKIIALAHSLRRGELLQPIGVRRSDNGSLGKPWELIWGERRLRAAKAAGWETIPAKICKVDWSEALLLMGDENLNRDDWNAIERARYIDRLGKPVSESGAEMTTAAIAKRFNRSTGWVRSMKQLLELPDEWQQRVIAGKLTVGKALALVSYADQPEILTAVAADMKENPWAWRSPEAVAHNARLIAEKQIVPAHPYKPRKLNAVMSEKATGNTNRSRGRPAVELDQTAADVAENSGARADAPADPPTPKLATVDGDVPVNVPPQAPASEFCDAAGDVDQSETIEYLRMLTPYRGDRQALEIIRNIAQ